MDTTGFLILQATSEGEIVTVWGRWVEGRGLAAVLLGGSDDWETTRSILDLIRFPEPYTTPSTPRPN